MVHVCEAVIHVSSPNSLSSLSSNTLRYCECFAALVYCRGCNCSNCKNTAAFEEERQKAIKSIRERNPSAFESKINTENGKHLRGCHCKKSGCKKKWGNTEQNSLSDLTACTNLMNHDQSNMHVPCLIFVDTANVSKRVSYVDPVVNVRFVKTAVHLRMLSRRPWLLVPLPRCLCSQLCL